MLVPPGRAPAVARRVRRSSVPVAEALRMDVIATDAIADASTGSQGTRFAIPCPIREALAASTNSWLRFRPDRRPARLRSGRCRSASGARPRRRSRSPPFPPRDPEPASALLASVLANGDVRLTVTTHGPTRWSARRSAPYRFEVHRLSPGLRPVRADVDLRRAAGDTFEAIDPAPPAGSAWSVRVVDPIGRVDPSLTVAGSVQWRSLLNPAPIDLGVGAPGLGHGSSRRRSGTT